VEKNSLLEAVDEFLRSEITRGTFPGAQYVIGEQGSIVAEKAFGFAVIEPERIPASVNTIYDLASLTKPLITTLLTVRFAERRVVDLAAPASDYLEELRTATQQDIKIIELLTHTSGLEAWRPIYLEAKDRSDVLRVIAQTPRFEQAEKKVVYSDLNFILLGFLLEHLGKARLDELAQREIFQPLGLTQTMFNPPAALRKQIAATECGRQSERQTVADRKVLCPSNSQPTANVPRPLRRNEVIWGEVHDGNAYSMDGVAGHAGLFSTAREVYAIARQFLPSSQLLHPESLSLFTENLTAGHGDARSVGWMLAATPDCSAGSKLPPDAFGHTGFTGTSIWIDVSRERVLILLTNRVHPEVRDLGMKQARQTFHNLAVAALEAKGAF
jgi:CubicO group peptidase (beta-lactamase class C family)